MNVQAIPLRTRPLSNVLADLKEARRDVDQAQEELRHATLGLPERYNDDLQDRATEAETRLEDLREEAAGQFARFNGITIEQFRKAFEDGLL